jgi:hypothetical protein
VAVQRKAEIPRQEFFFDDAANGLAFRLHRRILAPPVPGQAGADAMPPDQKGHPLDRIQRRVAHQVDPVGVGPRAQPHAARIDDGHEHEAHGFEHVVQQAVPAQAVDQALQIGDHHCGTDALQTMHPAEAAHGGHVAVRIAERDRVDGKTTIAGFDAAQRARVQIATAGLDDLLELDHLGQSGHRLADQHSSALVVRCRGYA